MSQLIRLVYASRSTFTRSANHQGLDPGVARILAKSRKNNTQRQIVGGLLFGDGCFLQCLEGEAQAVQSLYAKIAADTRHRDVTVLSQRPIAQRSFGAWSMKYVPGEQALSALLRDWRTGRFDPYTLSPERLAAAVSLMQDEPDAADTLPGGLEEFASVAQTPGDRGSIVSELKPSPGVSAAWLTQPTPAKRSLARLGVWLVVGLAIVAGLAVWQLA